MKKILFAAVDLDIGGIETALVNLLNYLTEDNKYEITLVLEKKTGVFLSDISSKIKIIEYIPSKNKIVLIRKAINMFKQIGFKIKYKNKFDFAGAFATYSLPACFIAKTASINNAVWVHNDYLELFDNNKVKVKEFFGNIKVQDFKNIIFVADRARKMFLEVIPELKKKTNVINNLIDYKKILSNANELGTELDMEETDKTTIFINVGRHDEHQKKLSRIIEASKKLKEEKLDFKVLFVGAGKDTKKYKEQVKEYGLEGCVLFLGKRRNPYPYYKISDCVILSSNYEGYPVVFVESMVLGKPIITTKVSDYKDIEGKYGLICEKDSEDIYKKMKQFIEEGYVIKEEFNPEKFNKNIIEKLEKIIEDK